MAKRVYPTTPTICPCTPQADPFPLALPVPVLFPFPFPLNTVPFPLGSVPEGPDPTPEAFAPDITPAEGLTDPEAVKPPVNCTPPDGPPSAADGAVNEARYHTRSKKMLLRSLQSLLRHRRPQMVSKW